MLATGVVLLVASGLRCVSKVCREQAVIACFSSRRCPASQRSASSPSEVLVQPAFVTSSWHPATASNASQYRGVRRPLAPANQRDVGG